MSPNQIRAIIKRHEEKNETIANKKKVLSLSSQAYKLFSQRKTPLDVTIQLNLPGPEVQHLYTEYWRLKQMAMLFTVYQELGDSIGYFLKLFRLGKKEGLTPEQIIGLVKTNDNIHKLSERFHNLQSDVMEIESRKFARKVELETLDKDIKIENEELSAAKAAYKVVFEEFSELCYRTRKVKEYVEKFRTHEEWQELEFIVRNKLGKLLANNRKFLENVLVSLVGALRNDPDRHLLLDRMELTFSTPETNYLASGQAPYPPRYEQFVRDRVLDTAEKMLNNLLQETVEDIISTAAGVTQESPHYSSQALPYNQSQ